MAKGFKAWDEGYQWVSSEEMERLLPEVAVEFARENYVDVGMNTDGEFSIYSSYDNGGNAGLSSEEILPAMRRLTNR